MLFPGTFFLKIPKTALADSMADFFSFLQILKPAEKKQKYVYGAMSSGRPITPPRKQKKK